MLLGAAAAQAGLPSRIEVSADDPKLAEAAASSLSLQYPYADVRPLAPPVEGTIHVSARRVDAAHLLIVITRDGASAARTLAIDTSLGTLDLAEAIALAVPELLPSLAAPPAASPPAAPKRVIRPPPPPETATAPPREGVAPVPAEPGPPIASSSLAPAKLEDPRQTFPVASVAATMLYGGRALPGVEAGFFVSYRGSFDLGLVAAALVDAEAGRQTRAALPVGLRSSVALRRGNWAVRVDLGVGMLVLVRGSEADPVATAGAGLSLERRLSALLELGVRLSAVVSLAGARMMTDAGSPVSLPPVFLGVGLTTRWSKG